ncbi:MAG: hypothetical protein JRH11_09585 [Deltaproteobacteria bacterium]|nr:hypothetical protein [Deltaproteobacteria bacterium]
MELLVFPWALLLTSAACGAPPAPSPGPVAHGPGGPRTEVPVAEASPVGEVATAPPPDRVHEAPRHALAPLLVTDAELLMALDADGLALHDILGAEGPSTRALHRTSSHYRAFVDLVGLDDSVARWRDPSARVGLSARHRLFNPRWLNRHSTRFELVAIVNRMDRIHTTPDACGEVRLIYRLAYGEDHAGSRLPMTLNAVFIQSGDCPAVARWWLGLADAHDLHASLRSETSPLGGDPRPARLEVNFQSGRWPSGIRPSLGGHAEYVLRVFHFEGDRVVVAPLENTPTQRLGGRGRTELRQWLRDNVAGVDDGTAILPAPFLAERSVSVHPRGLSRYANRPWSQILPDPERPPEGVDFETLSLVRSQVGLMRRLDEMSCKGCHATRALAGFHILGEDRPGTSPHNAIEVGISPHLLRELPFRADVLRAIAEERPLPARPFADRGASTGRVGDACGLGDPTFEAWTCAEDNVCKDRHGDDVGACAPADGPHAGDGTEAGLMTRDRRGLRDRIRGVRTEACLPIDDGPARAAPSANGFPNGICAAPCETFGTVVGDRICGPVPNGQGTRFDGFTRCLSEHRQNFDTCLGDDAHPTWLRRCDLDDPCRDDYLCVAVPDAPEGQGACMPPYFLFQVRVDGHLVPD